MTLDDDPLLEWDEVQTPLCAKCSTEGRYRVKWDAAYCPKCWEWMKPPCKEEDEDNSQCPFKCWNRPEKPESPACRK